MKKFLLTLSLVSATTMFAQVGVIKKIVDGDTLHTTNEQIRFAYIDTPESHQNPRLHRILGKECRGVDKNHMIKMGKESTMYLKAILSAGEKIKFKKTTKNKTHDRIVAEIFKSGISINQQLVSDGYAVPYFKYIPKKLKREYSMLVKNAKQNNRGLWSKSPKVMNCLSKANGK